MMKKSAKMEPKSEGKAEIKALKKGGASKALLAKERAEYGMKPPAKKKGY